MFKIVQARVKCYPSLFFRIYQSGVVQAWVRLIRRLISSWVQFVGQRFGNSFNPATHLKLLQALPCWNQGQGIWTQCLDLISKKKILKVSKVWQDDPGLLDDLAKDHLSQGQADQIFSCFARATMKRTHRQRPKVPTPSCVEAAQRSISCGFLPGEVWIDWHENKICIFKTSSRLICKWKKSVSKINLPW